MSVHSLTCPPGEDRKGNLRKPLSGTLQITVRNARELDHAPLPKRGKVINETSLVIKVEDTPLSQSHQSRNDRWNEDFEIQVENANEVEITLMDKQGGDHAIPIGLVWIRISDIVEELRRKKVGTESGPGWVTAGGIPERQGPGGVGSAQGGDTPLQAQLAYSPSIAGGAGGASEGIDAWFAVEPAGAINLHVNFSKFCLSVCVHARFADRSKKQ